MADKDDNQLLVIATSAEYSIIETALKKLDIPQRQVIIDVTIAEVTLTDELQFGVSWLFKGGAPSGRGSGGLLTGAVISNPVNPGGITGHCPLPPTVPLRNSSKASPTSSTTRTFRAGSRRCCACSTPTAVRRWSPIPHVSAADNQKATIKSGNRIPINQQTLVGGTTNAVTTTSQYIDTGVLLQVTPHINAGGLVSLDVQAEVSIPGNPDVVGNAPPINTRSVQTYVTVQTGQTMVMGGLISDSRLNNSEGLPLLSRIPILGGLFGNQDLKNDRTELVLFITPRVVENELDMARVIEDLRRRMDNMDRFFPHISPFPAEVFPRRNVPPGVSAAAGCAARRCDPPAISQ